MSDKEDIEKKLVELLVNEGLGGKARDVLSGLTINEAKTLKKRFGLDLRNSPSLEEIGKQFDITRERIRAIEKKALGKSRNNDGDPDDDGPDAA